ncbi:MAG: DinB family protein [Chloroflexota bacterium]
MTDTKTAPTRETFRKQLEDTQAGFHQLLGSLSEDDFKKKSGNQSWSNGQLLWHTAWGLEFVPQGVDRARKAKNLNLPRPIFNVLNPWITRFGSRGITIDSVGKKYDEANAKALELLATVKDDEWEKGVKITGNFQTIEYFFSVPANHFAEHKTDVLKSLGRA